MVTKNQIKIIRSLATRKGRKQTGWFVAEGPKLVADLQEAGFTPVDIFHDVDDVKKVSFLQHPQGVFAIFEMPSYGQEQAAVDSTSLTLALDGIQDPGNLGTIIRVADWFGISDIFCSHETADCWNPKVVQATMGSIARVRVHYGSLVSLVGEASAKCPVYTTQLDGENIYQTPLTPNGIIVMGNEGNGVTAEVRNLATRRLLVPSYPNLRPTAESLNVSVATAIVLGEFRRRMSK